MSMRQISPDTKAVWDCQGNAYASQNISKGEVIEVSPAIPIPERGNRSHMDRSRGYRMYYQWDTERDIFSKAAGMGALSGYAFSDEHANTEVTADLSSRMLTSRALRDIRKGEHLVRRAEFDGYPAETPIQDPIDVPDQLEVNPIQVADTQFGKGIVATRPIKKGELVELCPMFVMHPRDRIAFGRAGFMNYAFWWGTDKQGTSFFPQALAMGYGGIYNHSSKPNLDHTPDTITLTDDTHSLHKKAVHLYGQSLMEFHAIRDIEQGEELLHDYGWDKDDHRFQ